MVVENILILAENPEEVIEKLYAHKEKTKTKSKTHVEYSDGTRVKANSNPQAIKGEQADAVIVGKQISNEVYDRIVKTRVNGKNGIVVKL